MVMFMSILSSQDYEQLNVHDTYDNIAKHFSDTRHTVWKYTKKFISSLKPNSNCLEIGCGNGKNMCYRQDDLIWKGAEICENFISICKGKELDVCKANALDLPFEDNCFDVVISIAVIHHLSTPERRKKAVQEMFRVLKPGGRILLEVWSIKQGIKSKRKFETLDNMVSWEEKTSKKIYQRYYHVFDEGELSSLVRSVNLECNLQIIWEMDNDIADIQT
jgi:ubiquinone/menaquinone biosynthesis C-methylase UbiE